MVSPPRIRKKGCLHGHAVSRVSLEHAPRCRFADQRLPFLEVVQDARLSFASSMPLLQLPAPPPPASRRPSISQARAVPRRPSRRMQRRIPSATQIFGQDGGPASSTRTGEVKQERSANQLPFPSDAAVSGTPAVTQTPTRPRRNTIGTRSPKPSGVTQSPSSELNSPSKRKERWRSQGNLLDRKIVPSEILSVELDRCLSSFLSVMTRGTDLKPYSTSTQEAPAAVGIG